MPEPDELDSRLRDAGRFATEYDDDGMLDRIVAEVLGTSAPVQRIGRFVIERSLGAGGMGTVFVATDPELERRVALKMLRRDVGTNERRRRIIEAEARALARLADRHVVQVYETGEHEGALFVVMELVDGTSLEVWQSEKRGVEELVDKYVQAARGLAAAHRAGLVHRDFKPANVLLRRDGEVRVADFGLAQAVDRERTEDDDDTSEPSAPSDRSRAGSGTREYMAPEQLAFGNADARTDQFSFCVALHEALSGRRPYDRDALRELALEPGRARTEIGAGLPRWIASILARGLQPDPSQRWPSMDAIVGALVHTRVRRRRVLLGIGVGLVGVGTWWLSRPGDARPSCDASTELARVWNEERADVLRGVAVGLPAFASSATDRAAIDLDAYANRWRASYTEACEATWSTGLRTELQFEAAAACLDRARVSLGKSIDLLLEGDAEALARASDVVAALREPESCLHRDGVVGSAPKSEREGALLEHADAAALLLAAGRARDALAASEAIALDDSDRHAAAASAWLARGMAQSALARFDEAEAALLGAVALALAHDDPRTGLRATNELVRLYALSLADRNRASIAEGLVDGWAQRVELSASETADTATAHALAAQVRGELELAEAKQRDAIAALEEAGDPAALARARLLLGAFLQALGRRDEARALYEDARASAERVLGARHPDVGAVERALGSLALVELRYDDAERHLDAALDIHTEAFGESSVRRALSLAGLADVSLERGDPAAAASRAAEAWALERTLPVGHVDRGWGLLALARAHLDLGDYAASFEEHELLLREWPARDPTRREGVLLNLGWLACQIGRCIDARAWFEEVLAAQPSDGSWHRFADSGLANVELDEDRPAAATERARRVLREIDAAGTAAEEHELVTELEWTLARALERTHDDPAAMLAAARSALEGYRSIPNRTAQVADVQGFLARHGG